MFLLIIILVILGIHAEDLSFQIRMFKAESGQQILPPLLILRRPEDGLSVFQVLPFQRQGDSGDAGFDLYQYYSDSFT